MYANYSEYSEQSNFECNNMMLEPRLQEYIKKKQYYKKNNIMPVISAEQEFSINGEDVKRIKAFLKGKKNIYDHKEQDKYIEPLEQQGFETDPDEMYKCDPRFKRYLIKVGRDKEASRQRHMQGDIDQRYFKNILNDKYYDKVDAEYNKGKFKDTVDENPDTIIDDFDNNCGNFDKFGDFEDRPALNSQYSRIDKLTEDYSTSNNKYKYGNPLRSRSRRIYEAYPPVVQKNVTIYPMKNNRPEKPPTKHCPQIDKVIGNLETYAYKINKTYRYKSAMDDESKVVTPCLVSGGKNYINTSSYQAMPYLGRGDGMRDISIESEITQGMASRTRPYSTDKTIDQLYLEQNSGLPCRGTKSYGYRNPVEHFFDYVDGDIQDPDHVIMDRPEVTRTTNHVTTRPKGIKREVL